MEPPVNYDSPKDIKELLNSLGFNTLKRWGQNFLINPGVRERIIGLLNLGPQEPVWEIGPGLGAMTYGLLEKGSPVTAFEIDPGYGEFLIKHFSGYPFQVVAGDVLRTWQEEAVKLAAPVKVMGNLPYNAASAILADFTDQGFLPPIGVFMVQKEMAQRMTAPVGEKNYSAFSVAIQTCFDVKAEIEVRPGSFFPPPEVTSTVVTLKPHGRYKITSSKVLSQIVRESFSSRRKTLRNNLPGVSRLIGRSLEEVQQAFADEGIDLVRRAETLDPGTWVRIAARLS